MRAGQPTGDGIRLRVYGIRLATVPAGGGFQLVKDEQGRLVPTGERYRIPRAAAAQPTQTANEDAPPEDSSHED
jgi:N-methylhydantoinase A/oxoprolinase/acetone carboxylase beta subunit